MKGRALKVLSAIGRQLEQRLECRCLGVELEQQSNECEHECRLSCGLRLQPQNRHDGVWSHRDGRPALGEINQISFFSKRG